MIDWSKHVFDIQPEDTLMDYSRMWPGWALHPRQHDNGIVILSYKDNASEKRYSTHMHSSAGPYRPYWNIASDEDAKKILDLPHVNLEHTKMPAPNMDLDEIEMAQSIYADIEGERG